MDIQEIIRCIDVFKLNLTNNWCIFTVHLKIETCFRYTLKAVILKNNIDSFLLARRLTKGNQLEIIVSYYKT